jgi:hypothetical protein
VRSESGVRSREPGALNCCLDFYDKQSSLFIPLLGVIRLPKLKPISEQKAENIFVPDIAPNRSC